MGRTRCRPRALIRPRADSTVSHQFGADSIPTTVVLDKKGRAAGASQGYSEEQLDQIDKLTGQLLKE